MRCSRCWKKFEKEIWVHTCVPYLHYKGITWIGTLPNWETFDFVVDEVRLSEEALILKITSWEHKGKYSYIHFNQIDSSLHFNINK